MSGLLARSIHGLGLVAAISLGMVTLGIVLTERPAVAAGLPTKAEQPAVPADVQAEQFVHQAISARLAGNAQRRQELLAEALKCSPDCASAHWQLGETRVGTRWLPFSTAQAAARADGRLVAYHREREKAKPTVAGQLALGRWCQANQLLDEAQAHFTKVLELQPGEPNAIAALGLKQHQGQWLTQEQISRQEAAAAKAKADLAAWKPVLHGLVKRLEHGNPAGRKIAAQELKQIKDPAAIGALEAVGNKASAAVALEFMAVVRAIPDQSATESLLRQAVSHRAPSVREAAINGLKARSPQDYVPILLSGLQGKVISDLEVSATVNNVQLSQSLTQEGDKIDREQRTELVVPTTTPNPYMGFFLAESLAMAKQAGENADRQARTANRTIGTLNDKLCNVLGKTTGQDFEAMPRQWWDWWARFNEVYASGERPQEESYYTYQYNVPYYVPYNPYQGVRVAPVSFIPPPPAPPMPFRPHHYCFAKGTKVLTISGLVAIDELQTGDRVLAQDTETGELAYKPVFRTTLRPMRPMMTLRVGNESITATLGHLFWVSGQGWKMAKELQPGDRLYGVNGDKIVDGTAAAPPADAYNLVLADFGTYFVGESAVLVHDNTARQPTRSRVPGLTGGTD